MRALVAVSRPDGAGGRACLRTDYPRPIPGPGDALVRVTRAGVCTTDLEVLKGYRTFDGVLGHEFVGVVAECGDPAWAGLRVACEINVGCGDCPECARHRPAHCVRRHALGVFGRDGGFADYVAVPLSNLHALPAGLPDDAAAFVEPLAAACEILEQLHVRPGLRVVVVGAGRLGLLCAQVLALTGCELTVLGRHADALKLLCGWGIPARRVPAEDVSDLRGAADVVVDCTGTADGFTQARALVRPRGTLVLKSTFHGTTPIDLSGFAVDEITLMGSRCGPFPAAIRLLAAGHVQVMPLVSARYGLAEAEAALEHAARPGVLKVLIEP